jgi:hypothetical protein
VIELAMKGVLDRLIELAKYREKRSHDRFDGLIKPLHQQMQKVHSDHLRMFGEAASNIQGGLAFSEAIEQLWMARNLDRAIRHELFRQVASLCQGLPADDALQAYLKGIIRYVETFSQYMSGTPASFVFGYLKHVADGAAKHDAGEVQRVAERRERAAQVLSKVGPALEGNWVKVTDNYAALLAARYS